jgi:hypothetical protein
MLDLEEKTKHFNRCRYKIRKVKTGISSVSHPVYIN